MSEQYQSSQDVVICGGGLAGLLLARHLHQELPELSVTIIERQARPLPPAAHKVGESSVELGCQYLEGLGLGPYLLEEHLVKLGLRFFPGGGTLPLHERTEIGPFSEPVVRSYQMDRGKLENDLRAFCEQDGVTLIEGAKVTDVDLQTDGSDHTVKFVGEHTGTITAHWVIDATGRQALLRKRMKTTRGSPHGAHSGWFRVKGRVNLNDMVPASETEWHERPCNSQRWRSTNHFMGHGYWAWLIPLSTGFHSVGLVIHDDVHGPENIAGLPKAMAFLEKHEPHLRKLLENYEVEDYLCLKGYSHNVARSFSPDRWALIGEAGLFVDPLYSPGTDFIAAANHFTVDMIRTERGSDGQAPATRDELLTKATHLNLLYRALFSGCIDLFRRASPVFGHPSAMATKIFWDNFLYWSFTCHLVHQGIYKLSAEDYEPYGAVGQRFILLSDFVQGFLHHWATLLPEGQRAEFIGAPHYPSVLVDAHVAVAERMSLEKTLAYVQMRIAEAEVAVGEIVLRGVQIVGPELAEQLLERSEWKKIGVPISAHRIEGEAKIGKARREHLTVMARDVERTLGRITRHPEAARARELLIATTSV